jgi:hypothetical protein
LSSMNGDPTPLQAHREAEEKCSRKKSQSHKAAERGPKERQSSLGQRYE